MGTPALSTEHPRFVALFAVSEWEYVGERPNLENARGFAAGAAEGGSYFGDGVSAFVLPDELASLEEFLTDVRDAGEDWDRVKEQLPAWALGGTDG